MNQETPTATDAARRLVIGNRNYSSWSLRPWLCLRWAGLDFETEEIDLAQPGYGQGGSAAVRRLSSAGHVPILVEDDLVVSDSLAIAEWAAELEPSLWPSDPRRRARARSAVCEMHAGLAHLRGEMPMNLKRKRIEESRLDLSEHTRREVEWVLQLWQAALKENAPSGPWLFGERSIVDAFYLPVVVRFRTYGTAGAELDPQVQDYCRLALEDADFLEWERASAPDSWDGREHGNALDPENGLWQPRDLQGTEVRFPVIDSLYRN